MYRPLRLRTAPENLQDFVLELLPSFTKLYGARAGDDYARRALSSIAGTLSHPSIRAYGMMKGRRAIALAFARLDNERWCISFVHVLTSFQHGPTGSSLMGYLLGDLAATDLEIVTDFVAFHSIAFDKVFEDAGMTKVPRQIMRRETGPVVAVSQAGGMTISVGAAKLEEMASVLVDSYAHHSDRRLFREVQSLEHAQDYLLKVHDGAFGPHHEHNTITAAVDGQCAGFVIGSEVLPGLGFVLHMVVRPAHQGRGLGKTLLGTLCNSFAAGGLEYIALAVTCDNPAVRLYEKVGFREVVRTPVYIRK